MSQENVEAVERMLELFHAGNAEDALARFSPDVVTDASRRPDRRVGRGRTELGRIIGEWMAAWENWTEEIHEIRDVGDRVLVVATQRGRGRESGVEVATNYATIYGLRDGEITSVTLYPDPDEAFAAAGLRE